MRRKNWTRIIAKQVRLSQAYHRSTPDPCALRVMSPTLQSIPLHISLGTYQFGWHTCWKAACWLPFQPLSTSMSASLMRCYKIWLAPMWIISHITDQMILFPSHGPRSSPRTTLLETLDLSPLTWPVLFDRILDFEMSRKRPSSWEVE